MANQFKNHDCPSSVGYRTGAERPSDVLAHRDVGFLEREDLRSLRFQIEMLKPELMLADAKVESTFVIYGSARCSSLKPTSFPQDKSHYDEARTLARLASSVPPLDDGSQEFVVCSGGGPHIMEAANRGATDVGKPSIALNIVLPNEQESNPFVTPGLTFQFHYFSLRKMHFILRAKAFAVFPGGFGTLDEFFDAITLMQTGKMPIVPIMLFDKEFWQSVLNFEALVSAGTIDERDLSLFHFVSDAEQAWDHVQGFYRENPAPVWHRMGSPKQTR